MTERARRALVSAVNRAFSQIRLRVNPDKIDMLIRYEDVNIEYISSIPYLFCLHERKAIILFGELEHKQFINVITQAHTAVRACVNKFAHILSLLSIFQLLK